MSELNFRKWNIWERFLLYGLCGFGCEIVFTATWEAIENGNRKLHGLTSIYAFVIYAISALVQEQLYRIMKDRIPLPIRGIVYLTWSYSFELSSGLFLRQFDACPWDYATYFRGHFLGLITAEYIPVWYIAHLISERYLIRNALNMCWYPEVKIAVD